MVRMIRKQTYIDPEQDASLKKLANTLEISQSELIRLAIGSYIDSSPDNALALNRESRAEETESISSRPRTGGNGPFKWNREELYEEILSERIDRKSARWQRELKKMDERHYVKLLGETETKWDRNQIYDDRIDSLPG